MGTFDRRFFEAVGAIGSVVTIGVLIAASL
jgi:hypothetical protein